MQILLDQARYQKLLRASRRRGVSVAAVMREAIDLLPEVDIDRKAAIDAILAAEPIELPLDPADLKKEIDEARGRFDCY